MSKKIELLLTVDTCSNDLTCESHLEMSALLKLFSLRCYNNPTQYIHLQLLNNNTTEHFTDLKLWWFGFRLEPIFDTIPTVLENNPHLKK